MQATLSNQNVSVLADGLFFQEKTAAMCHFFFCHQHNNQMTASLILSTSRILFVIVFDLQRHFFLNSGTTGPTCLEICSFAVVFSSKKDWA